MKGKKTEEEYKCKHRYIQNNPFMEVFVPTMYYGINFTFGH